MGRARRLITSFDAVPGDVLVAAVDHRGAWREPFDNWQAALGAPPERLRGDMEILPRLAEDGLVAAGKAKLIQFSLDQLRLAKVLYALTVNGRGKLRPVHGFQ